MVLVVVPFWKSQNQPRFTPVEAEPKWEDGPHRRSRAKHDSCLGGDGSVSAEVDDDQSG